MSTAADPLSVIEKLDPAALRQQIADLDRQRAALAILLRAAYARGRKDRPGAAEKGGPSDGK
jgi:hypothetical protein